MEKRTGRGGRPRSEQAREAILEAVDDLLLEVGYAALTMKGIAERAGVGRQTVYRWWSTKAEVLFEASAADAEGELDVRPAATPLDDLIAYLDALTHFLTRSPAGAAYRALIAAAQQDRAVADLIATKDVLGDSARVVLERLARHEALSVSLDQATALLVGPVFFWIINGRDPAGLSTRDLAEVFLREVHRGHPGIG